MVDCQIHPHGVNDPSLLRAFLTTPRDVFCPPAFMGCAYGDQPIPLKAGRFMTPPWILAKMIDSVAITDKDAAKRVLCVGLNGGYFPLILLHFFNRVTVLERDDACLFLGEKQLESQLRDKSVVFLKATPLYDLGDFENAFDFIFVDGTVSQLPLSWSRALSPQGRMVCFERMFSDKSLFSQMILISRTEDTFVRVALSEMSQSMLMDADDVFQF